LPKPFCYPQKENLLITKENNEISRKKMACQKMAAALI